MANQLGHLFLNLGEILTLICHASSICSLKSAFLYCLHFYRKQVIKHIFCIIKLNDKYFYMLISICKILPSSISLSTARSWLPVTLPSFSFTRSATSLSRSASAVSGRFDSVFASGSRSSTFSFRSSTSVSSTRYYQR